VARERLRSRLEALRGQLARETSDLDAQAETLRQRLHLVSSEVERIQRDIHRELQSRSQWPDGPVG
jgi:predicted  nucleic acid-binding Zn-ribbon protein